jgi:hypothetical protein
MGRTRFGNRHQVRSKYSEEFNRKGDAAFINAPSLSIAFEFGATINPAETIPKGSLRQDEM